MKKQNFVEFIKSNFKSIIFGILIALWFILIYLLYLIWNYNNILIEVKAIFGAITVIYLLLIIYIAKKAEFKDNLYLNKNNKKDLNLRKKSILRELEYNYSPYVSIVNKERRKLYNKLDVNSKKYIVCSRSNNYLITFDEYMNLLNKNEISTPDFFSIACYLMYSILDKPVIKVSINKNSNIEDIKKYRKIQQDINLQIAINSAYLLVSNYYESHSN